MSETTEVAPTSTPKRRGTTIAREDRRRIRLPRVPTDIPSAVRYAAWILHQTARGNLTDGEARAMTAALREFRALIDARDADAKLAEARQLLAEIKAAKGAR